MSVLRDEEAVRGMQRYDGRGLPSLAWGVLETLLPWSNPNMGYILIFTHQNESLHFIIF